MITNCFGALGVIVGSGVGDRRAVCPLFRFVVGLCSVSPPLCEMMPGPEGAEETICSPSHWFVVQSFVRHGGASMCFIAVGNDAKRQA